MRLTMTNNEIYNLYTSLANNFNDDTQKFPVKVNFYLQKNKNNLFGLAQDIEIARMSIINTYGEPDPENGGQYIIKPESIEIAQKELNDLFELEQDVEIYKISIDSFPEDMNLTAGQMNALLFMIE